jgi:FKBP-type peptidyl-prolyl cis-trans isomerase
MSYVIAAPETLAAATTDIQTQVHALHAGDGPVVPGTARVSVCYMGVNGRDGSVFDSPACSSSAGPVKISLTASGCDIITHGRSPASLIVNVSP